MEELRGFTLAMLYERINWDDATFTEWLQHLRLLHSTRTCECGKMMRLRNARDGEKYPSWRCSKKCEKTSGFLKGTFFEGTHLTLKEIFQLSYFWCFEMVAEKFLQFQMRRPDDSTLGSATITDHKNFFRDMCVEYFAHNPIRVGGPGRRVQIDEAFVTKRKYNKGRLVNDAIMIFGGIEEETGECFIWPVERRDAVTLLALIQQYILPGTTIVSDCWRAYRRIGELPEGYRHLTVNHSINFMDPDTGAHTNLIEQLWQKFKRRHKHEFGTARSLFDGYVADFCWRQRFKGPDIFYHLWSQIASFYDIESV